MLLLRSSLLGSGKPNVPYSRRCMTNSWLVRTFAASCALFLVLVSLSASLFGQQGQATLTGTVEDASGALLAGVNVTVTNKDTGVVTKATSNSSGVYTLLYLPVGTYNIQASKEGFKTEIASGLVLTAEQQAGENFTLTVGQVTEKVEVSANAQAVETESAALAEVVNERAIEELPLNGRNPADLVLLTPGTTNVLQSDVGQHQSYTTFPIETGATSSGGRQGSTVYFLDGAYNQDNYHLLAAPFPNPDATQEFKVIGNNFDARYGFAPGGVVSIVTKSGTNQWHGVLFEYLRNNAVNATEYFSQSTDLLKRNQFGGSMGGPIVKDKLFIFGNYQGTRQRRSVLSGEGYVPTTAMRGGDFSAYCQSGFDSTGLCLDTNSAGQVQDQLWLPTVGGINNSNAPTVAQAHANPQLYYPNNFICQNTTTGTCATTPWAVTPFDTAALTLVGDMPTNTADQYGRLAVSGWPNINDYNEETFKGDYNLTKNQRISGRAFINFFNQPPTSVNLFTSDRSWTAHWQSYAGTWTWTINPHTVNNFTFSYSRLYDTSNSGLKVNGKGICYSELIPVSDPSTTPCSIEGFGVGGGYDRGGIPLNAQNFNGINRYTWGFSDSVSISKGKHLIIAGVDVMRQYWYENTDWLALPIISWNGGPNGQFTGSSFADFLLGDVGNYLQGGGESNAIHAWMIAPYIADQIKLKPNLTVDLGLRYEPWLAPLVAGGRISTYIPGEQSVRYPNAPAGLVFPGDPGVPSAGLASDHKRFFDPRIGIAWQPKGLGNTSIRAAIGMFAVPMDYANFNHASDLAPFSPTYQFQAGSIVNSQTIPIIPFSGNPYGKATGGPWSAYAPLNYANPFPPFSSPGTVPPSSAAIITPVSIPDGFTPNYTDGRTYTWNLSIEHLFGSQWLAKAAYVGSETDHQSIATDENYGQFFGAGNAANGTRLNQNFGQVLVVGSPGTANYQAGEFTLEKKFFNGLQFNTNFTYSHDIDWYSTATTAFTGSIDDPRCLKCNRANSSLDVPKVLNLNFVYVTPALKGSRGMNAVLGGWQVSGIWSAHSGNATELYSGVTTAWDAVGGDHLDYAPGKSSVSHNNWRDAPNFSTTTASYLNKSDFAIPAQGSKGDAGRDPTGMFYPGWNNWDLGLSKSFSFTERYRMQFRWELFNAFNRETFGCIDNNFSDAQFGRFGCSTSTPRTMQLALKLFF